jgi:hypothetical protein
MTVQERPAMGAGKTLFRFSDPLFGSQFLPARYAFQHPLFRDLNRESLKMVAREIPALMTALDLFFIRASPDGTNLGKLKRFLGSTTITGYLLRFCSENRGYFLFKLLIIVAIRRQGRTHTAIHSTRGQIFFFYIHKIFSFKKIIPTTLPEFMFFDPTYFNL